MGGLDRKGDRFFGVMVLQGRGMGLAWQKRSCCSSPSLLGNDWVTMMFLFSSMGKGFVVLI